MMRSGARIALCVTSVLLSAVNFTACGSSSNDSQVAGSAAGAAASSAAAANGGGALNLSTGGTDPGLGVAGIDDSCAADVSTGKLAPLDLYIMLDVSSSMLDVTATNVTKWDAVKAALETFLQDDASAGIGVGLQYFPIQKPNAPTSCASDRDCTGDTGPCFLKWCYQAAVQLGEIVACASDADCGAYFPCTTVAQCSKNSHYICGNVGAACDPQDPTLGTCTGIPPSICEHTASCDIAVYAAPAQPIAVLPGAAAALTASIDAKMPDGATPTGPALSGALQQATAWAKAHPDHRVVTLLATDGVPTECSPTDIAQVSAIAASGVAATPSIDTFVIGVFGPADVALNAPANLDTIASAGNTTSAYIVDTTKDVTTQFVAALDAIRGKKLDCAFQIPQPSAGKTLAYKEVNVRVKTASGTKNLFYVKTAELCDPTTGGWYYDVDPDTGATPTKIFACPTSCTAFQAAKDASVEIALGCRTFVK